LATTAPTTSPSTESVESQGGDPVPPIGGHPGRQLPGRDEVTSIPAPTSPPPVTTPTPSPPVPSDPTTTASPPCPLVPLTQPQTHTLSAIRKLLGSLEGGLGTFLNNMNRLAAAVRSAPANHERDPRSEP
jgi:hypothetical protein